MLFSKGSGKAEELQVFFFLFDWLVLPTSYSSFTELRAVMIWNFDRKKDKGGQTHRLPRDCGVSILGDIQKLAGHGPGRSGITKAV